MTTDRNDDHSHVGPTRRTINPMDKTPGTPDTEAHLCGDPTCPGHDGLMCHYEGVDAWTRPTLTSSTSNGIVVYTRTT